MKKSEQARNARTDKLLAHFRGIKNEFGILHGILCMTHPFKSCSDDGWMEANNLFDGLRIAARLDELQKEALRRAGF